MIAANSARTMLLNRSRSRSLRSYLFVQWKRGWFSLDPGRTVRHSGRVEDERLTPKGFSVKRWHPEEISMRRIGKRERAKEPRSITRTNLLA